MPAQLISAMPREHGVAIGAVDINHSHWDCVLEPGRGTPILSPASFYGRYHETYPRGAFGSATGKGLWRTKMRNCLLKTAAAAMTDGFYGCALACRAQKLKNCTGRLFRSLGLDRRSALWAVSFLNLFPAWSVCRFSQSQTIMTCRMSRK